MADGLHSSQLSYRYEVIDMHQMDHRRFLDQAAPDAWLMAVLCDFKGRPAREVLHELLSKLLQASGEDSARFREYLSILEILASNRNLNVDIQEEVKMLQIEIEQLPTYQIGKEQGIEKGIEKGLEQGIERGGYRRSVTVAKRLFALDMSNAEIAAITELPVDVVEQLRREAD